MGTAAFVLLGGKWEDSCAEQCMASIFPAKLVLPGKPPLQGRGTTPEKPRTREKEVLELILQIRERRWWPLREGTVGLPLLQARLLCPPETRQGFEGALAPFPHIPPRRSSFQRWQNPPWKIQYHPKVLFFGSVTTSWAKLCSPGLPDQCRSPEVPSLSILQKCHSHAVLPHGTGVPPPRGTMPSWSSTGKGCPGIAELDCGATDPPIPAPRLLPKALCPAQSPPKNL